MLEMFCLMVHKFLTNLIYNGPSFNLLQIVLNFLYCIFCSHRPSFVKIGQALSSRPDLLPRVYLETLSELQDSLPSFPHKIAMSVIEEELGGPVETVFKKISSRPVAAASLGQVGLKHMAQYQTVYFGLLTEIECLRMLPLQSKQHLICRLDFTLVQ